MRKSVYTSLLLLSALTLAACGQQQAEQTTSSSSSSVTVASSSSVSSSSSTAVESSSSTESSDDASSTESEEESEAGRFDLDLASLKEHGYTAPVNMDKYVGSYSAEVPGGKYEPASVVELVINKDGSYRKLEKFYWNSTADEEKANYAKPGDGRKHGYFDSEDIFHFEELPEVTVAGETYLDQPLLVYTQGVLMEKFGDIYLKDLFEFGSTLSGVSYNDHAGRVDDLGTLLGTHIMEEKQRIVISLPGNEPKKFLPTVSDLPKLGHVAGEVSLSENLDDLISIKGGQIASENLVFSKNARVSPLVQSRLSDLITDEAIRSRFENLNGLFQLIGYPGGGGEFPEPLDWSKVYSRKTGESVAPGLGYRYEKGVILIDNVLYETFEEDGKFIINDD